jgi:hypothetical protein
VRDALVTALVTYALQNGITAYTAIASVPWFSQIMTFGWDCRPLGMPRDVDGKPTVALRIEITLETPSCSRMPGSSRCPCPTMASSWPEGARSMDTINIPYAIIAAISRIFTQRLLRYQGCPAIVADRRAGG